MDSNFAAEAFDKGAIDYLLKPISYDRFLKGVRRFKPNVDEPSAKTELFQLKDKTSDIFYIKGGKKGLLEKIRLDELICIESNNHFCLLHQQNGLKKSIWVTISSMETDLPPIFIRVQRSFIINSDKIQKIEGNAIYLEEHEKPIICSAEYRQKFKEYISNRIIGEYRNPLALL